MELLTQKGVSAMGAPVIQVGGEWDIQQGNGFRVHVNNQSAGPDDNQLHAFCTHSGGSVRSKDARGFVVGDDAEYAFACTMISLWEGARA
jgi:hypothetical protein